jgi:hypothetical protein
MDPRRTPASYRYLITPIPVVRTDRVGRFAKDVWSVLFTYERMNAGEDDLEDVHLSKRQIVRLVGSDRKAVRRAFDELARVGLIERGNRIRSSSRQRSFVAVRTLWPEWLAADADDLLLASIRRKLVVEDEDDEEGEGQTAPRGEGQTAPTTGGKLPPLDQEDQVEDQDLRGAPPHGPPEDSREGGEAVGEEVEESDPDGESRGAEEELAKKKAERATSPKTKPRRKVLANGDDEFLREPSRRPEMNAWREKGDPRTKWTARDLVGYFVCRYRELRGEEPAEFFATSDAIFRHHGANVAQYVKRWLAGDYRRARGIVDKILERAADRGMPVKLGYFFTPAKEAAVRRLDEEVPRGRPPTPAERNDARGDFEANRAYWEGKKAEFEAREAERKAKENGRDG